MADVQPLRALRYDLARAGDLQALVTPPYDVIDEQQRARLAARSPYNAVHVDLPQAPDGGDPYAHAAATFEAWRAGGAVVQDEAPALYVLEQRFDAPGGGRRTRRGFLARVRVEEYGPGRIRPHERTHPGPREDRLKLTRATRANVSPIFSLYDDPEQRAAAALAGATHRPPYAAATDDQGTTNRLWRVTDPEVHAAVADALRDTELLIADGHHRYETARVYAEEIGGEGEHRYVLMQLVALQDPGLTVFPTHRLLTDLKAADVQERLGARLKELFEVEPIEAADLRPPDGTGPIVLGYIDAHLQQAFRLTLKDQAVADAALADFPEPYRTLDTAVLEKLILEGTLGMTEESIGHLDGLAYSRTDEEALTMIRDGRADAAFFLRSSPVEQVRAIAAAGVNMPPKSTFFHPKVPTGLVFNPLA